jgi:hypothetical protein
MEESKNKLVELTDKVMELSKEMEKALIEFTKKAGGKINTCNDDGSNDIIYAYVWDEEEQTYLEKKVIEVEVENDHLVITLGYRLSTEEDSKYSIFGGLILINATLYNLCEVLWEYVDINASNY